MLLEKVLDGRMVYSVDELIYPICFNMRHSIELRLKGAIEEIIKISKLRSINIYFDLAGSHDIGNIWRFFKSESEKLDIRIAKINIKLDQTINDIADVDATGQTFRYSIDKDSQKHLIDLGGVINCRILHMKFVELEKNLDSLQSFTNYLFEEYSLGTFTKSLSRADLFSIAKRLPARAQWVDESFKSLISEIRLEYKIGAKETSLACKLIQSNYEMAFFIKKYIPILGIEDSEVIELLDFWVKINPDYKDRTSKIHSFTGIDSALIDDIKRRELIKREVVETLIDSFSSEYLAGLSALFYFARDLDFSENYERFYLYELKSAKAIEENKEQVKRDFLHILSKSNLIFNILKSLYFIGLIDLAESIVKRYELDGVLEFLIDFRSGEAFNKNEIYGY